MSWFNIFNTLKDPPQELKDLPKTHVLISSAPENLIVAEDLQSLFFLSWSVSKTLPPLALPNYDRDLDAPKFEGSSLPGITIHGRTAAASFIATALGNCYQIHQTSEMPNGVAEYYNKSYPIKITRSDEFTWLEVGKGSPWKTPCVGRGN
jgi:hypothetical protein